MEANDAVLQSNSESKVALLGYYLQLQKTKHYQQNKQTNEQTT
jgi:hypothetical protein